jgi:hypothetical protein
LQCSWICRSNESEASGELLHLHAAIIEFVDGAGRPIVLSGARQKPRSPARARVVALILREYRVVVTTICRLLFERFS